MSNHLDSSPPNSSSSNSPAFDPALIQILSELRKREPVFHTRDFGASLADFARAMALDYCEIGASGQHYDREFILQRLAEHPPVDAETAGWRCSDFRLRRLGSDIYLLTYTLDQAGRVSRRSTLWKRDQDDWQIHFHQGTLVASIKADANQTNRESPIS